MKKRTLRKLTLRRETIRELQEQDLTRIGAGNECTQGPTECQGGNPAHCWFQPWTCTCLAGCPGG